MNKIKAIIIDDELMARTLLKNMLKEISNDIEVVSLCEDLSNGIKAIRKLKPEIVFLDIEMPGHSGLEILDFFNEDEIDFSIIFTTAYNQYAINAFKLSAVDYLLKPIELNDLEKSIDIFKKKTKRNNDIYKNLQNNFKSNTSNKIAVPIGNSIVFIELNQIVYLKADNSYCEIHLNDQRKIVASRTLKNFEEAILNFNTFFRCHKSYLVNLNYVSEYVKSEGGYLILKNNENIPISSEKISEFLDLNIKIERN